MRAIETKYFGPSAAKGSRITATLCHETPAQRLTATVSYDDALTPDENHWAAVEALREKLNAGRPVGDHPTAMQMAHTNTGRVFCIHGMSDIYVIGVGRLGQVASDLAGEAFSVIKNRASTDNVELLATHHTHVGAEDETTEYFLEVTVKDGPVYRVTLEASSGEYAATVNGVVFAALSPYSAVYDVLLHCFKRSFLAG